MFMGWVWKVGNNTSFAVRPSSHRPMLCGDDGAKFLEHTRGTPMLTNRGDDKMGTIGVDRKHNLAEGPMAQGPCSGS